MWQGRKFVLVTGGCLNDFEWFLTLNPSSFWNTLGLDLLRLSFVRIFVFVHTRIEDSRQISDIPSFTFTWASRQPKILQKYGVQKRGSQNCHQRIFTTEPCRPASVPRKPRTRAAGRTLMSSWEAQRRLQQASRHFLSSKKISENDTYIVYFFEKSTPKKLHKNSFFV